MNISLRDFFRTEDVSVNLSTKQVHNGASIRFKFDGGDKELVEKFKNQNKNLETEEFNGGVFMRNVTDQGDRYYILCRCGEDYVLSDCSVPTEAGLLLFPVHTLESSDREIKAWFGEENKSSLFEHPLPLNVTPDEFFKFYENTKSCKTEKTDSGFILTEFISDKSAQNIPNLEKKVEFTFSENNGKYFVTLESIS